MPPLHAHFWVGMGKMDSFPNLSGLGYEFQGLGTSGTSKALLKMQEQTFFYKVRKPNYLHTSVPFLIT